MQLKPNHAEPEINVILPNDLLVRIVVESGISEVLSMIQCSKGLKSLFATYAADFRTNSKLCVYKTYKLWQLLEGRHKESARRLLLRHKDVYIYRESLLELQPFCPDNLELPDEVIAPKFLFGALAPLSRWLDFHGKSITKTAIDLIIYNTAIQLDLEYGYLTFRAGRGHMEPIIFRHLIVQIARKLMTTDTVFSTELKKFFRDKFHYTNPLNQQFMHAAVELGYRYTKFPGTSTKLARLLKLKDLDFLTALCSVYNCKETLEAVSATVGTVEFQDILTYNPNAWCSRTSVFETAIGLAADEHSLLSFLRKLPGNARFKCNSEWLSGTFGNWFTAGYSEVPFSHMFRLVKSPELTTEIVTLMSDSIIVTNPWDIKLLIKIFQCAPQYALPWEYFQELTHDRELEYALCLAFFLEKSAFTLKSLMRLKVPSSFLSCFVQRLQREFLINSPVDTDKLISEAIGFGYTNDDGLFNVLKESLSIPEATGPPVIGDPHLETVFKIASSNLESMSRAVEELPEDLHHDLIMYDPNKWWYGVESADLVASVLNAAGMSRFIDRLPFRPEKIISEESLEALLPLIKQDVTILTKLLRKFPRTTINRAFPKKVDITEEWLPNPLSLRPRGPAGLEMWYGMNSEAPAKMIEYLEDCNMSSYLIKMLCLWHHIEIQSPT